jgi:ribose transport system permease protein
MPMNKPDARGLRPDGKGGRGGERLMSFAQKHAWTIGLFALLLVLLGITKLIQPSFGASGLESLARAALPFAFATAAMAVVVIVGGIDLSVASMMAVCAVTAAVLMQTDGRVPAVAITLLIGTWHGHDQRRSDRLTRVPDIVVTLAMLFVWEGTCAAHPECAGRHGA